ncbi:MAG: type I-E CRISPR-associated protein Cse2/CasB [Symbiobacterium thermophilum]|uniref:Type I-E CRISPR-associated protein Cse2/CasB n=2 Tax=Symbiobacterium thermophilum TaxID=2734 RepID=Q67RP2_SYMTH|nr:type I-E CRISPR-associated protein Cse2/CasB [Symbiobacterium thermophilum]BAD39651.1 conserved hypothetical protein [Symbiobacterium thermophilum IAM 14863]
MKGPSSRQVEFAGWLSGLDDRGTLAALRRGLMLEEEQLFELFGYVPPRFLTGLRPGEERLYLMVAALYAYHPVSFGEEELAERRRNLGESLRRLAEEKARQRGGLDEGEELLPESLKRRMEALLSAPRADLFGHLRQVISLLKSEEIPVDWAQLLSDLQRWEAPDRRVQWAWSRSFYVGYQTEGGDETDVR